METVAATATGVSYAIVLAIAVVVMLVPFIGAGFVLRDIVREARAERRARAAESRASGPGTVDVREEAS